MRYTQLTDDNVATMLSRTGVATVGDLFAGIPSSARLEGPLRLPPAMSEPELREHLRALSRTNRSCEDVVCFLGGGAYDHFIPAVVDALASQSAFVTAYTPYQPEASQGALQTFYEFQTMVCMLTGMDVANASLYEAGSATAEAVLMARSATACRGVLVAETVHPDIRRIIRTYTADLPIDVAEIASHDGRIDAAALREALGDATGVLVVQLPNFFGQIEPIEEIAAAARAVEATLIVITDPLCSGLLKPPGALGADVVVAEAQPLGIPLAYGGPWCGLLAAKEVFLRRLPGRLISRTTDRAGNQAFCLALQTREQHIRREKATSNICTNQGLLAIRATIHMAALGRAGLREVAAQCFDKAHYAAERIANLPGYRLRFGGPFFKEFVVECPTSAEAVAAACRQRGLLAGVPLGRYVPGMDNCLMIAVTEKRTRDQIDRLVASLASAAQPTTTVTANEPPGSSRREEVDL
jgi:glycine dehydrogenase subunit 1